VGVISNSEPGDAWPPLIIIIVIAGVLVGVRSSNTMGDSEPPLVSLAV